METLAKALGAVLSAMPQWLAAGAVIGMVVVSAMYFWRKAGQEARKVEEDRAGISAQQAAALHAKLDAILEGQGDQQKTLQDFQTSLAILLDRQPRG